MRTGRPKASVDVEYVCQQCGSHYSQPAWREDRRVFCSRECWLLGVPGRPKGSRTSTRRPCLRCGKDMVVMPSNAGKKFCSRECYRAKDGNRSAKRCTGCGDTKSLDQFYRQASQRTTGLNPKCKPCVNAYNKEREDKEAAKWREYHTNYGRRWHLRKGYALTLEQYDAMHDAQGGLCAICSRPESRPFKRGGKLLPLAVDHDHTTGKVRSLLCRDCNQALGHFNDSIERLQQAMDYLRSHAVE